MKSLLMPRSALKSSANAATASACATRSGLALPCPVPSSTPEPLDLKWLTITPNVVASGAPLGLKVCASGSRAFEKADELDRGGVVDERGADDVLLRNRRQVGRVGRRGVRPAGAAGVGVERVDEVGQRVVPVGVPEGDRVLDLLQRHDVGVHGVDRAD